ncbi:UrcA family protein [Sphingomonas crusticola]|uniref:UrcA family protein n=1 Tax=Sphingomonas crusticola TaxID=1697973 RepID=UPI000E260ADC|nr:UrcA family protein [Sphingomonas crusticola]
MLKIIPAILLAVGLPGIATAQDVPAAVHVSYHDLDLRSAAGIKALDHRLNRAVSKVCGDDLSADVWNKIAARNCHRAKLAEARELRDAVLANVARKGEAVASSR